MTTQANRKMIHEFIETVWNRGDLAGIEKFVSPAYRLPGGGIGPEGVGRNVRRFRSAFPDLMVSIADTVAEGQIIVTWLTLEGTHTGSFKGYPPSGNRVRWWEVAFWRVEDGRIVGGNFAVDMLGLRQGIGALPSLPEGSWTETAEPEN